MKHVIIGSPVKQKDIILAQFLSSLNNLCLDDIDVEFFFIDDSENGSRLLSEFAASNPNVTILPSRNTLGYYCDNLTHYWSEELIWRVAFLKEVIIEYAKQVNCDYLFLVDSDIYLHPQTIRHLVSLQKDLVAEVFWTKWAPDSDPLPQVWQCGQYRFCPGGSNRSNSEEECNRKSQEFLQNLKIPGVYKVGGLGACTLISRNALNQGVSFAPVHNLDLVGEDRHFCVRAVVLGLELYADTHFPPIHIYRESDLLLLDDYKQKITNYKTKLTAGLLVRNEADRYLTKVLSQLILYADEIIILDDHSEDSTVAVCNKILNKIPHQIVCNPITEFHNEISLRKKLWSLVTASHPDWIIILDADEMFEEQAPAEIRRLLADVNTDVYYFRLYDMWTEDSYIEQEFWQAHKIYRPLLVRYREDFNYEWYEAPLHCGRLPHNILKLPGRQSRLRVKHYGWMNPQDRIEKYFRYKKLDPQAKYGIKNQYLSILDPKPNLIKWVENENVKA